MCLCIQGNPLLLKMKVILVLLGLLGVHVHSCSGASRPWMDFSSLSHRRSVLAQCDEKALQAIEPVSLFLLGDSRSSLLITTVLGSWHICIHHPHTSNLTSRVCTSALWHDILICNWPGAGVPPNCRFPLKLPVCASLRRQPSITR